MNREAQTDATGPFAVIALVASAGGYTALPTLLRDLPADFSVPILVMQHLAPDASDTIKLYGRWLPFAVDWVRTGSVLAPRTVLVCPPRAFVELLPDGTCVVAPAKRGAVDKPMDRFLDSVARSFGPRAIGVVLTGMGADGALGARQLHLAGGRVLVQSAASAEFADMPKAAIQADAADLVVPLQDIGQVIVELTAGTPRPQPRSEIEAIRRVFGDEGQVAALAREFDWDATALGPVRAWSETLRSVIRLAMDSPNPVALWLGERAIEVVNDAALSLLGDLFAGGFAKSVLETAPERYARLRPTLERVWAGERVIQQASLVPIMRQAKREDAWWDLAYTPLREADGRITGVYCEWQERTADVLAARRWQLLNFEPTDLGALTADIASAFRCAVEAAGLRFRVECDPNLHSVWVDREMWEKVVSNLLSNAFKFTFEGEIAVELHALSLHAELVVKDTGIGIPEQEMPNLFKRFHRVRGARARTVEGSGIGLSIVDDLVKRLGGQLRARSKEHKGTEFTIWIPYKAGRIQAEPRAAAEPLERYEFAGQLADEASRWLLNASEIPIEVMADLLGPAPLNGETKQGMILVADDNADMRNYLQRLLGMRWAVELVADGQAVLKAAMHLHPDVILADVMLPGLDGFELIRRVREEPQLTHTPVVLLTARAGEEAAIQGLLAGADDYIAKPFSPRELAARIQAVFERSRAQAVLRRSEERQTFLLKLSDAVRSQDDPVQIQEIVAQVAMDYYGADRCYYSEIENDKAVIRRDASREGLPSVVGEYPLSSLPIFKAASETGQPIVVPDVYVTDLVDEALRQLCIQLAVIAYINVPVMKNGRFVGNMCITQSTPRHWTDVEVELAAETAERTWAAVERARAEAALRESQERYRLLFEAMDEGLLLVDVLFDDSGRAVDIAYLEANPVAHWMTGKRKLVGLRMSDVESGFDPTWAAPYGQVTLSGEPLRMAYFAPIQVDPDAAPVDRWFDFRMSRGGGDDSHRVAVVFQNVTERKRAEEELRKSEEKYRSLFSSMTEGFIICELVYAEHNKAVDWRWLEANPAFEKQVDLKSETIVGKLRSQVFPIMDDKLLQKYTQVVQTQQPVEFEQYSKETDTWLYVRAIPFGQNQFAVLFENIDARKKAEIALRESEERKAFLLKLSDALRSLADPVEIQRAAMRLVGEHLQVDRALYNEIRNNGETIHIEDNYVRADFPKVTGDFPVSAFGAAMDVLRRGEILVIEDQSTTSLKAALEKAASISLGVFASATVPLVKEGRWVASFGVVHGRPRPFSQDDIAILQETAERTWAAVERARAEAALRESEAKLTIDLADTQQLQRISSSLIEKGDIDALYEQVLDAARSLMHSEMASIQMLIPDRNELFLLAQHGFAAASAKFWEWVNADDTTGCGLVLRYGKSVIVPDVERWDLVAGTEDLDHYHLSGIRALLSSPLISRGGHLVGVLSTHWRTVHQPSERELRLLDVLARQAADLLEQRVAQEALRKSAARLQKIVNVDGIGVLTFDHTGTILYANDTFLKMLGYHRAAFEAQTFTWRDFTPPEYLVESQRQMEQLAQTGKSGPYEKEYFRKDGSRQWMMFVGADLGDGTIVEYAIDISDRKRAEEALRASHAALQTLNTELAERVEARTAQIRQLAAELVLAEQKERERIAHLLHDDLQQLLYALQMHLKLFHEDVTDLASPELLAAFHESETMIRQIIGLTRRLTVDLSPPVLQSEGLVEALRWLASHMARLYQLEVTIEAAVSPRLYSTELRIFLVQLVRELLFNIVKHAGVKQAQVTLTSQADALTVEVRDQGRGFDVAQILATPSVAGYGLRALQERLALFDGQMTIRSVSGGGTQITLRLPLASADTPIAD